MKPIVVVSASGEVREELPFHLRDYLKYDDLFRYGMTPQFVSRFESIVVLNDLAESDLARIFVEPEASIFRTSRAYFQRGRQPHSPSAAGARVQSSPGRADALRCVRSWCRVFALGNRAG